jgi:DNA polymerase III subunit delta
MARVRPAELLRFLKSPPTASRAILVFGPDSSLVRDRAEQLMRTVVEDLRDPFRVSDLGGDQVVSDPARLADEAAAVAMLGGRRVVRVRNATEGSTSVFEAFLNQPIGDALIVVEAGDLGTRAKLVRLFEAANNASAIACYEESSEAIEDFIASVGSAHNLDLDRDAVHEVASALAADRALIRSEIAKLALFVGDRAPSGKKIQVTRSDVRAATVNMREADVDELADAVAEGNTASTAALLSRSFEGGATAVGLLRAISTHILRLHGVVAALEGGAPLESALNEAGRFIAFTRRNALQRQATRWTLARLNEVVSLFLTAEQQCKDTGMPDDAIASRAILSAAALGRSARK